MLLRPSNLRLLLATCKNFSKQSNKDTKEVIRHGHTWSYRTGPTNHSKKTIIGSQLVGGFMWWWILWHLWHEHEHITGEFPYPDPSLWTNAELGIPQDDDE